MADPTPPAAHSIPVPRPKRLRNHGLTAAMRATEERDPARDSIIPKARQNARAGS